MLLLCLYREHKYDMDKIPGPWRNGWPLLGNLGELLTYDHHLKLLEYANTYGGIVRQGHLFALIKTLEKLCSD